MEPRSTLVVDDSLAFRETLRVLLASHGLSATCAANGKEALDQLQQDGRTDLILLDLDMPVMDGLTFLRRREHYPDLASIPVLVLSVDSDLSQKVELARIAGHLSKPFRAAELLAAIKALPCCR